MQSSLFSAAARPLLPKLSFDQKIAQLSDMLVTGLIGPRARYGGVRKPKEAHYD